MLSKIPKLQMGETRQELIHKMHLAAVALDLLANVTQLLLVNVELNESGRCPCKNFACISHLSRQGDLHRCEQGEEPRHAKNSLHSLWKRLVDLQVVGRSPGSF